MDVGIEDKPDPEMMEEELGAGIKNVNDTMMDVSEQKINPGLICNHCGKGFLSLQSLRHHTSLHTGEQPFTCHLCSYKGVRKIRLVSHIVKKHGEDEVKNANLKPPRIRIQVTQFFHCPTCQKQCTSKQNLENHKKLHNAERPFSCPQCSYSCILKHRFENHMLYYHGGMDELKGTLQCPKCPRVLHSPQYLKQHMLIHEEVYPHACAVCNDTFRNKKLLIRHMRKHPEEQANGDASRPVAATSGYYSSVTCDECGKVLANQFTFKKHLRIHKRKPFSCTDCEAEFKEKNQLTRHMRKCHKKDKNDADVVGLIVGL